ncbi:unnamed protein product, partial [Vitis vinifera]
MERHFGIWAFLVLFLVLDYGCFGCLDEERIALLVLKAAFCSPDCSSLPSWEDEESDCCGWERVECSNTTGRVLKLFLNNTRESSQEYLYINASLFSPFVELKILNLSTNMLATLGDDEGSERPFKLNNLELLDLSSNTLDISMLASLTELSSLKSLSLGTNILEGSIQELAALHNLEELDLSNNLLESFITTKGLKSLRKLRVLHLETNGFNISTLKSLGRLSLLKELYLGGNKLEELNNLRNLEVLDLSSTNISSSILQIVEVMTSLKALSLRSNGINGSQTALQGLCKLRNLQELDLSDNGFEGSVSPCLGNLTSLRALDLSKNRFSGNLDSSLFAGLMKLEFLSLSHNVFQTFPPISSFAKHSKLEVFRLSSCILKTGSIPSFLHHQHDLRVVDLSNSSLEEDFPTWLMKNNTRLEELNLKNNSLTGYFHLPYRPHIFTSAIDISNNLLQGQMPSNISVSLPNLMFLNVSRNSFEGSIPSFGGMRKLLFLDLSNNLFTGGIPEDLAMGCPSLEYLILSKNDLHGQMFPRVSNLPSLRHLELDVSHNSISGKLPGWIGNMSNLAALVMPNNSLEGPIPVEFCSLDALELLDLSNNNIRNNNLSGGIPDWISMFSGLSILLLKGNHFQGKIPYQLCQLSKITILDLSYNSLSGAIPPEIGNLSQVHALNLSHNILTGPIPAAFSGLKSIESLDLSYNNLTGTIPGELTELTNLAVFSVAYNNLSGKIPEMTAQEIDKEEFKKVMALMRAHNRQGSLHRDGLRFGFRTVGSVENGGLLEHFFGKDGKAKLQHEKFFQFMRDLHDELLILEFAHYDYKLRGSISAKDFALSMVASADLSHLNRLLDRVDGLNKQSSLSDIRITFEEFKSFAELRRRLRPFALALSSYGKVNGLLTKTDFQRAASNVCGISLSKCVVEIIFHVFDMNDDGKLSSEELVRVLQKRERDIAQPMESGIMGFFSCCCNHSNYGSISGLLS